MKKLLLSFAMLMSISFCMAQTAPINQTPAQLAEQMVAAISRDVTLTTEQQSQITTIATQYFTDLRNAAQSTPQERTGLYEQFQHSLQTIMTDELYMQWQAFIEARMQQSLGSQQ